MVEEDFLLDFGGCRCEFLHPFQGVTRPQHLRGKKYTLLKFKKALVMQLEKASVRSALMEAGGDITNDAKRARGRPRRDTSIDVLSPGRHVIAKGPSRTCKHCHNIGNKTKSGKAPKTNYICTTCPSKPNVHPACFEDFHDC